MLNGFPCDNAILANTDHHAGNLIVRVAGCQHLLGGPLEAPFGSRGKKPVVRAAPKAVSRPISSICWPDSPRPHFVSRWPFFDKTRRGDCAYPNSFPASQKSAMPRITVPPSDLVFRAKRNTGIATISSGPRKLRRRGSPPTTKAGSTRALRTPAGMKSSHVSSHAGAASSTSQKEAATEEDTWPPPSRSSASVTSDRVSWLSRYVSPGDLSSPEEQACRGADYRGDNDVSVSREQERSANSRNA